MTTAFSIPILMYHEVTPEQQIVEVGKKTQRTFILSCEQFAKQMQWLVDNGFSAISLPTLLQILSDGHPLRAEKKSVVITFDDGFAGNYFHALPILKQFQLTATFFVIVTRIGQPFYMSWAQLAALVANGMPVQSHTMTHALLGQATPADLVYELKESKCQIEQHLQTPVHFISLPHGSYDGNFKAAAQECGYSGGCTSEIAYVDRQTDAYFLPRVCVNSQYDLSTFAKMVQCRSDFLKQQVAARKFKRWLRRVVGERNYNRAYHFIYSIEEK
ncbi:MAG: hypothetical protein ALAOOOJD_03952 [bacterium]|nr:hypothetical protein [bacterium]